MIPKDTVDKILDAAQIADVVGDFVSLKRRGANYVACCPFHNEKTPSFYVSPAKGIFKCFGCGKSGTAVGFIMEHESLSYVEAIRYLGRKYNIEIVEKEESAEDIALKQHTESLYLVSEYAMNFFRESLSSEEGRAIGYVYYKSRGLTDETISRFCLGWSPLSRHAFSDAALKAGYKEEFLTETGLCVKRDDGSLSDRFYDRVVFPIHSPSGRVIAFGARTLKSDKTTAKYLNSPESEIYVKSRSLYGIYHARNEISRADRCYLVEGYLDVISMYQLGIRNVVASSGTSLTVEQIRLIKRYTDNVTIIYDGDSAGIHAALRGIGLVLKEGLNVKVVLLPDGDDPDSFSRKHTLEEVQEFIGANEQDFISFKSDLLMSEAGDDPIRKAGLINDIADTIALIPDAVKRSVYVEVCSGKFNIEDTILFGRIRNRRGEMLVADRKREENRHEGPKSGQEHTPDSMDGPVQPLQDTGLENMYLASCEKELLWFILNYGCSVLNFDRDSEYYSPDDKDSVAEFIDSALSDDNVSFGNTVYRNIYDAYFRLYDEGLTQKQIQVRLAADPDERFRETVLELLSDKYDISVENFRNSLTAVDTLLVIYVPKSLLAYQSRRLDEMLKKLSASLQTEADEDEQIRLLEKINRLNRARSFINNKLGRV